MEKWGLVAEVAHIDGLVQDYSISSALAMEILQSCIKPSIYNHLKCTLERTFLFDHMFITGRAGSCQMTTSSAASKL